MKQEWSRKQEQRQIAAGRPAGYSAISAEALSPGRKWLVRLVAVCIPLLLVFGGGELLLRGLGYGFDPHFFKRERVGPSSTVSGPDIASADRAAVELRRKIHST